MGEAEARDRFGVEPQHNMMAREGAKARRAKI